MGKAESIYRGWFVLAGLMIVYAVSNGLLIHTLPILYPTLIDEFGWDNVQVTWPATIFFILTALTSPPAGYLLDRYSPRLIMSIGAAGLIGALAAMSQVQTLPQLIAVYCVFAISLSLCGLVSSMVVLTRWFGPRRGRATGFLLLASSFGGAAFPWLVGLLLGTMSWREALLILAAIGALLMLASLVLLIRNSPLTGDGFDVPRDALAAAEPPAAVSGGPTLADALRQPTFYFVAVATASIWFCVVPLVQHQAIYLAKEVGVTQDKLPAVFSLFFFASMFGKLAAGWLGDHLNKQVSLILAVAVMVAGLLVLRSVSVGQDALIYTYAIIAGLGFSGAFTMIQVLVAGHFAGPSYGKILAIIMLIDTLAGGLGTRAIAGISEAYGSYIPAIDTMIGACVLAIAATLIIRVLGSRSRRPAEVSG